MCLRRRIALRRLPPGWGRSPSRSRRRAECRGRSPGRWPSGRTAVTGHCGCIQGPKHRTCTYLHKRGHDLYSQCTAERLSASCRPETETQKQKLTEEERKQAQRRKHVSLTGMESWSATLSVCDSLDGDKFSLWHHAIHFYFSLFFFSYTSEGTSKRKKKY